MKSLKHEQAVMKQKQEALSQVKLKPIMWLFVIKIIWLLRLFVNKKERKKERKLDIQKAIFFRNYYDCFVAGISTLFTEAYWYRRGDEFDITTNR